MIKRAYISGFFSELEKLGFDGIGMLWPGAPTTTKKLLEILARKALKMPKVKQKLIPSIRKGML